MNLHVLSPGIADEEIDRILTFRNWLRANETDRDHYAATKRELSKRDWKYGREDRCDRGDHRARDALSCSSGQLSNQKTQRTASRLPAASRDMRSTAPKNELGTLRHNGSVHVDELVSGSSQSQV